jgi:two-component system, chemotaxis family, CheB/CheR fusion protein
MLYACQNENNMIQPQSPSSNHKQPVENQQQTLSKSSAQIFIVGIGASAGGLEAIEQLFTNMPTDTGMAFVLIPHLDPSHKNSLCDIIKKYTLIPIFEVQNGMPIKPNCIYIIPPNYDMAILHGTLQLIELTTPIGVRLPIDFFFRSLAQEQQEHSIGIILSGNGSDGSLGVKAIKEAGGLVIVQDPQSATCNAMPLNAIATGLMDYILFPEKIMPELITYTQKTLTSMTPKIIVSKSKSDLLQKIFVLLRDQTGHDFSFYKKNTLIRRIDRRMIVFQMNDIANYFRYLQKNPQEMEFLFKELLIGVSNFFRNAQAFQFLEEKILSALFENKKANQPLRIWIPGCSTGEEAYSIAMLLISYMEKYQKALKIQIFATDIDKEAIEQARKGIYPENITTDVPPKYLQYFTQESNHYIVNKAVRDLIVFAPQNLIKDPPFSRLDLICCRNLLIYMEPVLQQKVLPLFHYALNQKGYLFLGSSESIGEFTDLFTVMDRKHKIFKRKSNTTYRQPELHFSLFSSPLRVTEKAKNYEVKTNNTINFRDLAEKTLLENYGATCLITNEKGEILYIHGHSNQYLELGSGKPNWTIIGMAREGLKFDLSHAIRQAITNKEVVRYDGLKVKTNNDVQTINLIVKAVSLPPSQERLVFIVIENIASQMSTLKKPILSMSEECEQRIAALEIELQSTREYLQTIIDELELSNEELKANNEESQSSNEELQSVNEELETSKEELQSVNEELVTVNAELENKIEELSKTNNDMRNLLDRTDIGTLFLDKRLLIQKFTPVVTKIIRLIPSDVGRPLTDIASNLVDNSQLTQSIEEVLQFLTPKEIEVKTKAGFWYLVRFMPYRTLENVVQGIVVTFIDISQRKLIEKQLIKTQKQLEYMISKTPLILFTCKTTTHFDFTFIADGVFTLTGYEANQLIEKPKLWEENIHSEDKARILEAKATLLQQEEGYCIEYRLCHKAGHYISIEEEANLIKDEEGRVQEIVGSWKIYTPEK